MKVKVGDKVCPSRMYGKVVKVTKDEVVIELVHKSYKDGRHLTRLTREQADTRKVSFDDFIDSEVTVVG